MFLGPDHLYHKKIPQEAKIIHMKIRTQQVFNRRTP